MSTVRERAVDDDLISLETTPPEAKRAGHQPKGGSNESEGRPLPEGGRQPRPEGGSAGESPPAPVSGDGYCLSPEEEADGELFLMELSLAGEPPAEEESLPAELACPSDEYVRWYRRLTYPKATQRVFQDPDLYGQLCTFCRDMANVLVDSDGHITQVFCLRCCAVISEYAPNRCTGGSRNCIGTRYVDAIGTVAQLCSGCHQREGGARREAEKRRGRAPGKGKTPPKSLGPRPGAGRPGPGGLGKTPAKSTGRARTLAKNPQ